MAEWYAKSSGEFFEIDDFYEEKGSRASRALHGIVDFSDPLMHSWQA